MFHAFILPQLLSETSCIAHHLQALPLPLLQQTIFLKCGCALSDNLPQIVLFFVISACRVVEVCLFWGTWLAVVDTVRSGLALSAQADFLVLLGNVVVVFLAEGTV